MSQWRKPRFLSPSALNLWDANQEEYFLKYLAPNKPPKIIQTEPMSVGSSFDAYIKAYLHAWLFGKGADSEFGFDYLFTKQVEEHNRDFALEAGKRCFYQYKQSGALDSVKQLISKAINEPKMEIGDRRTGGQDVGGVVLYGIPDLQFNIAGPVMIVFDWKVNGYCSASGVSPAPGYKLVRDGWTGATGSLTRTHGKSHKDYEPYMVGDVYINIHNHLEECRKEWARQIATYSWIGGLEPGKPLIAAVDQLACRSGRRISVAEHRCEISQEFQTETLGKYSSLWEIVQSDHIFRHLSPEESNARCVQLNQAAAAFTGDTVEDDWFRKINKRGA